MPNKTLNFRSEKCHGGKHSKQRLTLLLAANMDGSEKLKPLILGKSANPRCFKGIKSFPVKCRANKKSWMTTKLFNEWLTQLNKSMKKQKRKILLFMDNCTVHNHPPLLDHIKLQFFTLNTTSKLQPLDQGVIQNFKTFYRKEIVKIVLDRIENELPLNITILAAMTMVDKAWKNVRQQTILNCFRTCGFIVNS